MALAVQWTWIEGEAMEKLYKLTAVTAVHNDLWGAGVVIVATERAALSATMEDISAVSSADTRVLIAVATAEVVSVVADCAIWRPSRDATEAASRGLISRL